MEQVQQCCSGMLQLAVSPCPQFPLHLLVSCKPTTATQQPIVLGESYSSQTPSQGSDAERCKQLLLRLGRSYPHQPPVLLLPEVPRLQGDFTQVRVSLVLEFIGTWVDLGPVPLCLLPFSDLQYILRRCQHPRLHMTALQCLTYSRMPHIYGSLVLTCQVAAALLSELTVLCMCRLMLCRTPASRCCSQIQGL